MSITETMDIIAAGSGPWIRDALCGKPGYDPDLWFPECSLEALKAIRVCRNCPVRRECLSDALERGDTRGIRGGVSGNRRSRMLRRRNEKAQSSRGTSP